MAKYEEPKWGQPLVQWLKGRGYVLNECGARNPATGRGWYSHPCEYKRGHIRVRVNSGGIIILRDPGCTIQIERPAHNAGSVWAAEFVTPNMRRMDYPHMGIDSMRRCIEAFESRPAYTISEAMEHFFGGQRRSS